MTPSVDPARRPPSLLPPALAARQHLPIPRHVATTAHLCALYPFALQSRLDTGGVLLGADQLTGGGPFTFDLFDAYQAGLVQGPNMVISGAGAHGKSALAKAYVYRSSLLHGPKRFVAVIDPKGEWTRLAGRLGWAILALRPGGDIRINPLDPGPAANPTAGVAATATMLAIELGQPDLTASQHRLIGAAIHRLSTRDTPPTLTGLRRLLADPPTDLATELDTTPDELTDRRRPLLDAAALLLDHDLRGITDDPATITPDWATTPGLVLDLSALLTNRKALRLVLTAAAGWLAGLMYHAIDRHKLTIIDEGWAALDDLAVVKLLQDQWRLGRQWGTGNILITHALADLRSQTDDGTAHGKIAEGFLNTTSVRVFLHQNPEQIHRLLTNLGLTTTEVNLLRDLAPFQALWKIGPHTALTNHPITGQEWALYDTDTAMVGSVSRRC
jgi:type IV secretory pathway VirB4 component